jgi:hypothetical protein
MNYKEENVDIYTRAVQVLINNPLQADTDPSIKFFEEKVKVEGDSTVSLGMDSSVLHTHYTEMNKGTEFNLLNPDDNSVVGTQTYEQFFMSLYSLYWHMAQDRDSISPVPESPAEEPPVEEPVSPPEDDDTVN